MVISFIYGMRTPNWIGIPYTRIGFLYLILDYQNLEINNNDVVIFEFQETLGKNMLKMHWRFRAIKLILKKELYILMEN